MPFRYGLSSLDGVDGLNMIINDGGMVGWGPTALLSPADPKCKIPALSVTSTANGIPSFPLVGSGPLGLTTVQNYLYPGGGGAGVSRRCIHMNPKLSEFTADSVPHAMWAYLWTTEPAHGCFLPDGRYLEARRSGFPPLTQPCVYNMTSGF